MEGGGSWTIMSGEYQPAALAVDDTSVFYVWGGLGDVHKAARTPNARGSRVVSMSAANASASVVDATHVYYALNTGTGGGLIRYLKTGTGSMEMLVQGTPVVTINESPLEGIGSFLKRIVDVIGSLVGIVLSAPILIVAALLVKLTSRGPVLFKQERMGLDGKAFQVLKFRSMYQGAEDETGPIWARDNDPRCTPVGKWLRRFDLDELPQLWNVVRGDMSIVGPRPERPYFVEQFKHRIPQYMLRHKVKAGITGWAQVNGWRGNTSLEKRIEFDLYYIENWSLSLDFKIMWLTVLRGFHRVA
jgi:exopolysaccharide biosynthesis polyprenyl glycosylphosphotransferase